MLLNTVDHLAAKEPNILSGVSGEQNRAVLDLHSPKWPETQLQMNANVVSCSQKGNCLLRCQNLSTLDGQNISILHLKRVA